MNDDEPYLNEEQLALRGRLKLLQTEHADLDASIEALGHMPIPDQLRIARLKRRKLQLRDEIAKVADRILPDIIA
ncbi:YdcH family protein [Brevundimonas sp.]|uniref:YdcH family protein n=1 Tax=Brevundimonas sp. TaxID=1871086 RepID=UPI003A90BAAB